jgi:glycosyltransferase involved in cell wall biosynthesis
VRERYHYSGPIQILENAVPDDVFYPRDGQRSRQALGLPEGDILVGTAGALTRSRGIETLFKAFRELSTEREDVHLVLAGPRDPRLALPTGERIHDFGMLPSEQVPLLLSALDISVICNRETAFGSYCFPQKLYESVACRVPVLVAATAAMREHLREYPESLFWPDDPASLVAALRRQLAAPAPLPLKAPTWGDLACRLEGFLAQMSRKGPVSA